MQKGARSAAATGLMYGVLAYLVWGFFPVYFKALEDVPPLQVVSHRIVWSLAFLLLIIVGKRKWQEIGTTLVDRRAMLILATTAVLIATNWLVFIVAVGHAQVLQSSLGYFISPFVSVLLGFTFLKERLNRLQLTSLLLAAVGVLFLTVQHGRIPWVALTLAATFGSYGLLRKVVSVDSLTGLTVETVLLSPLALAYLLLMDWQGTGVYLHGRMTTDLLLMAVGVVTAVPLLLFASAARRLRLATIGFLQYLTPTLHFLLAVVVYGEPFSANQLVSFLFIWAGLACYSLNAYRTLAASRQRVGQGMDGV